VLESGQRYRVWSHFFRIEFVVHLGRYYYSSNRSAESEREYPLRISDPERILLTSSF
jgi:hypothetical protein